MDPTPPIITNNFTVVLRAVVVRDSKILIMMRTMNDSHGAGRWEVPGGKLENGEIADEAVKREIKEETGLTVESLKPLKVTTFETPGRFVVGILYQATNNTQDDVIISSEHDEYKWINPSEIDDYPMQDWIKEGIASLL